MREFVAHSQRLSLPQPLIRCMLMNSEAIHLRKLYHCCKLFYSCIQKSVVCEVKISYNFIGLTFDKDYHKVSPTKTVENVWTEKNWNTWEFSSFELSTHLQRFGSIDTKHFKIDAVRLSWNDFELLTDSGIIETFHGSIVDPSHQLFPIEDIISRLPDAYNIV